MKRKVKPKLKRRQAPKLVVIFGIRGECGKWFQDFFEGLGYLVKGCEVRTSSVRRLRLVRLADIVVFAVPITKIVQVMKEVIPASHERQVWVNTTSVQVPAIEVMKESRSECISFRVMASFSKGKNLDGEKMLVCFERLSVWKRPINQWLVSMQASVERVSAELNDAYFPVVTKGCRILSRLELALIAKWGINPNCLGRLSTKHFAHKFSSLARVALQKAELDADLMLGNPEETLRILDIIQESVETLREQVSSEDRQGIIDDFVSTKKFFPKAVLQEASEKF